MVSGAKWPDEIAGDPVAAFDGVHLKSAVDEILNRRPAIGLAVGVVRNGSLEFFHGHGVADLESRAPITEHTAFRVASITKTFTAIAVMQLWEQGLVDLDAPANNYLRAYRLIPLDTAWHPATLRHLLTHTAGLPEVAHLNGVFAPDFGESVEAGQPLPSLEGFYGAGLRLYAEPGSRFVYNNHGPATVGQIVEDVSGEPLQQYFHEHIFEKLGMTESDLIRSEKVKTRLAMGYEIGSHGLKKVDERDLVTTGAASIYSTPRDMSRYLAALLGGGSNKHGSILKPETLATMFEAHYQPDPRIPGMGLGFFRKNLSGHLAIRHQGTLPGFHSEMCVVPDAGIGVMAFTNGGHQADFWLPAELSYLLRRALGVAGHAPQGVPQRPELWDDLCGWYRLSARLSDVRLRGMIGAGAEVFVRAGRLMFRFLTPIPALAKGLPLLPDDASDPHVFRIDLPEEGLEPIRIVFGQGPSGAADRLHLDLMPVTLKRQPDNTNPRRWAATGVLGGLGVTAAAGMLRSRGRS